MVEVRPGVCGDKERAGPAVESTDSESDGPALVKSRADRGFGVEMAHQREWLDCVAYTVMPDHAHIVFGLGSEKTLRQVMHSFSRNSSRQIHQAVGGEGRLWQKGYYDDRVEDEEQFENQVRYVLYNPVKAGHVRDPDDWPFSGYLPEW